MHKYIFSAFVLLCLSASAQAVTIDFEGYSDDTLITDQYAALGIVFDGAWIENGYPSRGSGINWISGEVDGGAYNGINPGAVSGHFVNPLNSLEMATTDLLQGLAVYPDGESAVRLEVFDLMGNLLTADEIYDDGLLSVAVSGIASFSFYHVAEMDDVLGYDDIVFNDVVPETVPEPGLILLLASGLFALGMIRRHTA